MQEPLWKLTLPFCLFQHEHESTFLVHKRDGQSVLFGERSAQLHDVPHVLFERFPCDIEKTMAVSLDRSVFSLVNEGIKYFDCIYACIDGSETALQ